MNVPRTELLDQLAEAVTRLHADRPTLVALDGRSAAGKTTLADELAVRVSNKGRPVLRSSIDDFHPPGHKYRSIQRRYTPQAYYAEGYDYSAFRASVLEPLRDGSQRCRLALWDSFNDVPFPETWTDAPSGVVVLIDGVFLLRPDLQKYWDYSIWVHIDWETMVGRAAQRDGAWVKSVESVVEHYRTFWIPTHQRYEAEINPMRLANVIVDNRHPETPARAKGDTFEH